MFYFRAYRKATVAKDTRSRKKLKISRLIAWTKSNFGSFDKVWIKIRYSHADNNEGYYTNYKDLYNAWMAFLEVCKEYK